MTLHVAPLRLFAAPNVLTAAPVVIRTERAADARAREALLDEAFGPARFAKTSQRLRDGRLPAAGLALAADDADGLAGTLRCWNIDAGGVGALLLGPLAVARSHRALGIGARLMNEALSRAATAGHRAVLLVGDAPYYERFGFKASFTQALDLPGPVDRARFLGLEIEAGALRGACGLVRATGARATNAARLLKKAA
jgi:predicted N-acetyltransferase YhbS